MINLADCFFDMEYLDASKGLEIYKQSIADNERLSNFYAQASIHAVLSLAKQSTDAAMLLSPLCFSTMRLHRPLRCPRGSPEA